MTGQATYDTPIDVVIAWVDGNAPENKAKRNSYQTDIGEDSLPDIGGAERYDASGEIKVCVASILRFAPFVRTIYIVTDNQNPGLDTFVGDNFPQASTKITIVDHRDIFRGYEEYLPTFNSLSIETMLYRIPGLSERFVYFNDDFFVMSPITPDDWFDNGRALCYATRFSNTLAAVLRAIKPRRNGHRQFGFKDAMLNASRLLGMHHFWHICHAPLPLIRSVLAKYLDDHPEIIIHNIKHRFREQTQYNPQELLYLLGEASGDCVIRSPKGKMLFLKPTADKPGYLARKLKYADETPSLQFGCINSLGQCSQQDQRLFMDWIGKRLGVKL